jgi:hypothetical protein
MTKGLTMEKTATTAKPRYSGFKPRPGEIMLQEISPEMVDDAYLVHLAEKLPAFRIGKNGGETIRLFAKESGAMIDRHYQIGGSNHPLCGPDEFLLLNFCASVWPSITDTIFNHLLRRRPNPKKETLHDVPGVRLLKDPFKGGWFLLFVENKHLQTFRPWLGRRRPN